jgi:hypothetical protein
MGRKATNNHKKTKKKKQEESVQDLLTRRLDLIKRRHRELILEPREAIAADMAADVEDTLDEFLETEALELAKAASPHKN